MIKKDTIVAIHYRMLNSRGDTLDERSAVYHHGSSDISPLLQAQLEGLLPGQSKKVFLKKCQENADDDFTFDIYIESVREAPATPQKIKIHLLGGFLGSGKTTAIAQACRYLKKQNVPVAVITNDQGTALVDSGLFTHLGVPLAQVPNGCFCCNYDDLEAAIRHLCKRGTSGAPDGPAVLFAESVGSCTDLVATVLKPLMKHHPDWRLSISTFADAGTLSEMGKAYDPDIRYIYNKQLEEAKIIVVSKTDLYPISGLPAAFADKTVLYHNSFNDEDIARWLQTLDEIPTTDLLSLDIDYDRYGAGEAKLAWLDQRLEIQSPSRQAQQAALALMTAIAASGRPIAHLKCLIDETTKISFTHRNSAGTFTPGNPSDTFTPGNPSDTFTHRNSAETFIPRPAATASLLINARIQAAPAELARIVSSAILDTAQTFHCSIRTIDDTCFQPGYPRPTHRIA